MFWGLKHRFLVLFLLRRLKMRLEVVPWHQSQVSGSPSGGLQRDIPLSGQGN